MQTKKPQGRPKAEEPGTSVSAWLPTRVYDKLAAEASKEGRSVSALVRDRLSFPTKQPASH